MPFESEVISQISKVSSTEWDALTGHDDPFCEHAFLHTLEVSGSVGEGTGWNPQHLILRDSATSRLVGALPLYLKEHSYGEYIFDWAWADGSHRLGQPYYPKLVSMAPLTPATGQRFLVAEDADSTLVAEALLTAALKLAEEQTASSSHLLFLNEEERDFIEGDQRLLSRTTFQYHWHNEGYEDFDEFLAAMRSSCRKNIRKERRAVGRAGVRAYVQEGSQLSKSDWGALRTMYLDTCSKKGSFPYLTPEFFEEAHTSLAHRAVVAWGDVDGQHVASSLAFEKGKHLYGRYWGCTEEFMMLHFELCYYQLIERSIAKQLTRFEAGAQGSHKLKRGLMPNKVYSAHHLRDPRLSYGVADFLLQEAQRVQSQIDSLRDHGPFKRDGVSS